MEYEKTRDKSRIFFAADSNLAVEQPAQITR
jgi:hypothetical protein